MQKRCVANKRPKGQVVEHHLESVHVPGNSSAQPKALHMNQLRNFYLFKKLKSKQLSLCWVNLKGCHDEYLFIFHSNPEFWKRSIHLSCYPANQRNVGYLCNDAGLGFTLHQTVHACETCVVNLITTAKDDKKWYTEIWMLYLSPCKAHWRFESWRFDAKHESPCFLGWLLPEVISFPWVPGLRSDVPWISLRMQSNVNCRETTSGAWSGYVSVKLWR